MQRMSRAQRILVMYLLMKSQEPRVIKKIIRNYGSGVGKHGNDMHTSSFVTDHSSLAGVTANQHHTPPTSIADLTTKDHDLLDGLLDDDHTQYFHTDGTDPMTGDLTLSGARQIVFDRARIDSGASDDWLQILNKAGDDFGSLRIEMMQLYDKLFFNASGKMIGSTAGDDVLLRTFSGFPPVETTIATMEGGVPTFSIQRAGDITMLDQKMMQLGTYTDAQRPATGTAGRVIFNTDDGMPNYDDGANWRDINGNIT